MQVFFGPPAGGLARTPHEPPAWMRRPVEVLVLVCLLVGILPAATLGPYLHSAVLAVLGEAPHYSLAIWHGFTVPMKMSAAALAGGTALYFLAAGPIGRGPEGPPFLHRLKAQRLFERLLLRLSWTWPRALHRLAGTEALQPQLLLLVAAALGAGLLLTLGRPVLATSPHVAPVAPMFAGLWLAGTTCAIGAAAMAKYHRLAALILLGGAGLVTCVTFALFSAPDLALTQLLVEIVTTVLLLLGLRWLPKRRAEIPGDNALPARLRRIRDLAVAAACGAGIAVIAFAVMTAPQGRTIGDWFLAHAYVEGGGTNVVNVILVDFRAFDTLGEITVLAVVAITVFALLRRFRPAAESGGPPRAQRGDPLDPQRDALFVPSMLMQWMFPAIIMAAAYLFLRGHDLPGGGFAAGVTLAIGFLLQYLATDVRTVELRLTVLPVRWMAAGLVTAAATGMGAWLFGKPFLTSDFRYHDLPLVGEVPAATAMLFDAGVFALVLGATVLMLIAIAHQSLRSVRARAQEAAAEPAPATVPAAAPPVQPDAAEAR